MTTHFNTLKNINQWITALESDIYKQARGQLRDGNAMCCMGVACDISNISDWIDEQYINETGILPNEVIEWLGISDHKGKFYLNPTWILNLPEHIRNKLELTMHPYYKSFSEAVKNYTYISLVTLNDDDWTFKDIAELMRYNPPGLFNTNTVL